jgi:hypothetical protein
MELFRISLHFQGKSCHFEVRLLNNTVMRQLSLGQASLNTKCTENDRNDNCAQFVFQVRALRAPCEPHVAKRCCRKTIMCCVAVATTEVTKVLHCKPFVCFPCEWFYGLLCAVCNGGRHTQHSVTLHARLSRDPACLRQDQAAVLASGHNHKLISPSTGALDVGARHRKRNRKVYAWHVCDGHGHGRHRHGRRIWVGITE